MKALGCAAVAAVFFGLPALPADAAKPRCVMTHYADLPIDTQMDGRITVPISANDTLRHFMIDTGAAASAITATTANVLSLKQRNLEGLATLFGGRRITKMARVDTIKLDRLPAHDFWMIMIPSDATPTDSDGLLGADVLGAYDVEIDYAGSRFRLFPPQSCAPNPVYWTQTGAAARIPITVNDDLHISVPVLLDGKPVQAVIDTGAEGSTMSLELARSLFGLAANDPRLQSRGNISVNGNPSGPIFHFPFATLTFEGVQVNNPDIVLLRRHEIGFGSPDFLLGASILRQLHLYIAYKDRMLYVTGAEER